MRGTLTQHRGTKARSAMSWHEARARAHEVAIPVPAEPVALGAAAGRILAAPVHAALSLPGCDNAAMDGYAVRGPGPWRVVGRVLAGAAAVGSIQDGQAVEIATGAPVPAGAERVVRYEAAQRLDDDLHALDEERDHIRRAGEHVHAGQEVLATGTLLHPAALGLAASVGIDTLTVRRRPRVRILVTGDEVVPDGVPAPGFVRDAIGPMLAALVPAWGGEADAPHLVPDTPVALARELRAGMSTGSTVDVTVVCGASSVGPADHLHRVLGGLDAQLHVDGVACRPGHPQVLAQVGRHWIAGLPGNPYAALVAAHTILHPLLAGLAGRRLADLPRAPLSGTPPHPEHHTREHHTRVVPVRYRGDHVQVVAGAHPGYLGAAAHADALAVIPPAAPPEALVELLSISPCGAAPVASAVTEPRLTEPRLTEPRLTEAVRS